MVDEPIDESTDGPSVLEQWQEEQRNWQRLILSYVDTAATDESFLTNMGNAMRGSLLANKPYPGTSPGGGTSAAATETSDLDEVTFAVRRLEGQILELTMVVEALRDSITDRSQIRADADPVAGSNETTGDYGV
jgi:hypothetical protein